MLEQKSANSEASAWTQGAGLSAHILSWHQRHLTSHLVGRIVIGTIEKPVEKPQTESIDLHYSAFRLSRVDYQLPLETAGYHLNLQVVSPVGPRSIIGDYCVYR